jgi:hypothetical protein
VVGEGLRKVKAVKVKKIFLRILRKVMDLPQDSQLVGQLTPPQRTRLMPCHPCCSHRSTLLRHRP